MHKKKKYQTDLLSLTPISKIDNSFILELVNTKGWLEFIGDRKIHTTKEADQYIQKINNMEMASYWVVSIKKCKTKIGIITLLKRSYLNNYDIGFAFLPMHIGKGYAFEATNCILKNTMLTSNILHAITMPSNHKSIQLIERLGFQFDKKIEENTETLYLYSIKK
jgi:RimJ/RimL family protein N-acetyltransferase